MRPSWAACQNYEEQKYVSKRTERELVPREPAPSMGKGTGKAEREHDTKTYVGSVIDGGSLGRGTTKHRGVPGVKVRVEML